jgi:hypothetical protein
MLIFVPQADSNAVFLHHVLLHRSEFFVCFAAFGADVGSRQLGRGPAFAQVRCLRHLLLTHDAHLYTMSIKGFVSIFKVLLDSEIKENTKYNYHFFFV